MPNVESGTETLQLAEPASTPAELVRALLGMSRVIVAVFVLAHAGLAAILATKAIPDINTIIIGSFACVFGTGALIGLNDLLDIDLDRRRYVELEPEPEANKGPGGLDIGALFIHHPVARGVISLRLGIAWVATLSVASLFFIYQLKPALWPIFFAIGVFVVLYSLLGSLSYWKFMAVATAVTLGALAGWLTVTDETSLALWFFVAWTFLWEIGGRNVPNDFNDIDEDKALGVKTIPVVLGPKVASRVVLVALMLSYALSFPLFMLTQMSAFFIVAAAAVGLYLLLIPAWGLWRDPRPEISQRLYNRSAVYPLVLLVLLMANVYFIG